MKKKFLISFIIIIFLLIIFGIVFICERDNSNSPINDNTYNPKNEELIDSSIINSSVSEEQEANVFIEGVNGNETEKDFEIIIQEEEEKTEEVIEEKTNTITKPNNISISKTEVTTSNETTNLNSKQETTEDNISKEENTEDTEDTPKCTHSSENYYNSKAEAEAIYEAEIKKWGDMWVNDEIDDETYYKNCPDGYEVWSCPYCQKWTISFYY